MVVKGTDNLFTRTGSPLNTLLTPACMQFRVIFTLMTIKAFMPTLKYHLICTDASQFVTLGVLKKM